MGKGIRDMDIGYPRLNEEMDESTFSLKVELKKDLAEVSARIDESIIETKKLRRGMEIVVEEEIDEVE